MSTHKNEFVFIDQISSSKLLETVEKLTESINSKGGSLKTSIRTINPIRFEIIILESGGHSIGLFVNEDVDIPAENITKEEHLTQLPDAAILVGEDILRRELPTTQHFEYCRVEHLAEKFLEAYNRLGVIATGADGARLGDRIKVSTKMTPYTNKVEYALTPDTRNITINNRGSSVTATVLLSHYDDGDETVRQMVIQDKSVRGLRELGLLVASISDQGFYARSVIDLSPLKALYGDDTPWVEGDVKEYLRDIDIAIDIKRTTSSPIDVILSNLAYGDTETENAFIDILNQEFGFDHDYDGKIIDFEGGADIPYGMITIGDLSVNTEDITLAEALTLRADEKSIEDYESGDVIDYLAFVTSVNPNAVIDGVLSRYTFAPEFLVELKSAVKDSCTLEYGFGHRKDRSGFYKRNRRTRDDYRDRGGRRRRRR